MENSIARITTPDECGTCYFLTKNIVATCFHVVEGITEDKWDECEIIFHPSPDVNIPSKIKTLLRSDKKMDIAILQLKEEIPSAVPVSFLKNSTVPQDEKWEWTAYGYPASAKGRRIYLNGQVLTADSFNDQPRTSLQAVQAQKETLGGFSGSPVYVGGKVIGHLTDNTVDDEGNNIFGMVYATSSDYIYNLAAECIEDYAMHFDIIVFEETNEIYIKRGFESIIGERLMKKGQGVMLSGYLKSGKTHTIKFFEKCKDAFLEFENDSSKIIVVNLSLDLDVLPFVGPIKNLDKVFKRLCVKINDKLLKFGFKEQIDWEDDEFATTAGNVNGFFNKIFRFLEEKNKRLMLFIDDAGSLFNEINERENEEFFRILRGLVGEKISCFGLLVSFTSTLILKSPIPAPLLNMYQPVAVEDFSKDAIATFGNQYCRKHSIIPNTSSLSEDLLLDIKKEIAGNPWMLYLFFEKLRQLRDLNKQFVSEEEFRNKLSDQEVYANYLGILTAIIPAELKEEINLYDGATWREPPKTSDRDRRRKLVSIGILKVKIEGEKKFYKLRCRQFENI